MSAPGLAIATGPRTLRKNRVGESPAILVNFSVQGCHFQRATAARIPVIFAALQLSWFVRAAAACAAGEG